jgi:hypothetical protein
LRLRNAAGWGAVSHFRFQIDNQKPEAFTVTFPDGATSSNPTPRLSFATTDQPSGIAEYLVKVGDEDFIHVPSSSLSNGVYTLPSQQPGPHTVLVQAVDRAGNFVTASANFEVRALPTPTIDYPSELTPGDSLVAKGHTLPGATIRLTLVRAGGAPESQEAVADSSGNATLAWGGNLESASYQVSYQAIDATGAKSSLATGHGLVVHERPLIRAGRVAMSYLTVLVTLASLLLAFVLLVLYGTRHARNLRRKLRSEVGALDRAVHQSFRLIGDDLRTQLKLLDKVRTNRELTAEEKKIQQQLQRTLKLAERMVERELGAIEREVKD